MLELENIKINKGEKVKELLNVKNTDIKLPTTIINGNKEGKTVLITAGVHSCEYVGIETCIQLANKLEPKDVEGVLIIIPVLNPTGFELRMPTIVPEDGKNLNRVFPGKEDGTVSQRLAWYISNEIFPKIDFYVDLHSGGIYEDLTPYIYYTGNCKKEVCEYAKKAASIVDMPYKVKSLATTGAYNYAGVMDIPSLLIERGQGGRWSKEEVEMNLKDIENILKYVGTLEGEIIHHEKEPTNLENLVYYQINTSGLWYTNLKPGDKIKKNDELGYVTDYFGNVIQRCISEDDGEVLYLTKTLWACKDTEVITYAKLS